MMNILSNKDENKQRAITMRITVDVDENLLHEVKNLTNQKKMSPAVVHALEEFIDIKKRKAFVSMVMEGKTEYSASNEELEKISDLNKR